MELENAMKLTSNKVHNDETLSPQAPALERQITVVSTGGTPITRGFIFSTRFILTLLVTGCVFMIGLMRVNMSMAMVCMMNNTAIDETYNITKKNASSKIVPEGCQMSAADESHYQGELIWSPSEQGTVFSAFFWGSIITSLPAGWFSDRYSPVKILLLSVLLNLIPTLLVPISAAASPWAVTFLRAVMGLGQGLLMPCIASLLARWVPPNERSTVTGIYTAGNQLCMVVGMPLFAWLCAQHQLMGGWPSIFYVSGLAAIPWCILWLIFASNSPEKNKRTSHSEKRYIAHALKDQSLRRRKTQTPWKHLILSLPLMAGNIGSFAQNYSVSILQSYLPKYFKDVLYLKISENGFYTAAPFVSQWLVKLLLSYVADVMMRRTKLGRTKICKIFQSIACFGNGFCLIGLSFLGCGQSPLLAVFILCLSQGLSAGFTPGVMTSLMYIAPQYSGTVRSVTNVYLNVAALSAPYVVSAIAPDDMVNVPVLPSEHLLLLNSREKGTRDQWQIVFLVNAAILLFGGITFIIFGSAELQSWAKAPEIQRVEPLATIDSEVQVPDDPVQRKSGYLEFVDVDNPMDATPDDTVHPDRISKVSLSKY